MSAAHARTAGVTQLRQNPPPGAVPFPLCHLSGSEAQVHGHTDNRRKRWASLSRPLFCVLGYGDMFHIQSTSPLTPSGPLCPPPSQCRHPSSIFQVLGHCGGKGWQGWVHARHLDPSSLSTHHAVAAPPSEEQGGFSGSLFLFNVLFVYLI